MDLTQINLTAILRTINQILTAGVSITAAGIFLYALAFNIKDRVARSFGLILLCTVLVFTGEVIADVSDLPNWVEFWLRLKWFGIVLLPATYFHFSDALLTITGSPSRGRRKRVVWLLYAISLLILILIPTGQLVGALSPTDIPTPYLQRTTLTTLFTLYYLGVMFLTTYNLARVVIRAKTRTSKRRLFYLFIGAIAPAFSSLPYLFHGIPLFSNYPILYFILAILSAGVIGLSLGLLAYSVAFFGINWTDRVVKSRLFKWLMRGPFVASIALALTTIIRRLGEVFGQSYTGFVPIAMVGVILLLEYLITLLAPLWEKWLFYGEDHDNLILLRNLEDHLLTKRDLDQFLEIIVASICDLMQVPGAFISVVNSDAIDYTIRAGNIGRINQNFPFDSLFEFAVTNLANEDQSFLRWNEFEIILLDYQGEQNGKILLGICGFLWLENQPIDAESSEMLKLLAQRAALALRDRRIQQQVLSSLEELQPQVNYIQNLRAISRYDQKEFFSEDRELLKEDFPILVKDALVHYWGGPKLTESPLMKLNIVQDASQALDGNLSNALRNVLKTAIEKMRPEGDRRLTTEWILYNLLEMKYLEGKKVRDIASRLAMSEADLYRKQRIALEALAKVIIEMEKNHQSSINKI